MANERLIPGAAHFNDLEEDKEPALPKRRACGCSHDPDSRGDRPCGPPSQDSRRAPLPLALASTAQSLTEGTGQEAAGPRLCAPRSLARLGTPRGNGSPVGHRNKASGSLRVVLAALSACDGAIFSLAGDLWPLVVATVGPDLDSLERGYR